MVCTGDMGNRSGDRESWANNAVLGAKSGIDRSGDETARTNRTAIALKVGSMNLLFFQDTMAVSGGEIWVADAALKFLKKGHNVTLACPCGSWIERKAQVEGLPYFNYAIDDDHEGHLRWMLQETIVSEQIDLVFCGIPGYREEVPILDSAIREAGRGQIVLRLGVAPGRDSLSSDRVGQGFETVRGIILVSEDVRTHLRKAFPFMPAEQVHVIYNGVDLEKFGSTRMPRDSVFRRRHRIPEHHRVIGAMGRLDAIKNFPMLIDASRQVLRCFDDVTFVVAGDGMDKQFLIDRAVSAGVMNHFRFTGFVDDVPMLLSNFHVLAHTALSEGVPNAVIEAMAMGKAVVATDVGGVPELIENQVTGMLVPSNDPEKLAEALCEILQDREKVSTLGAAARAYVETHLNRRDKLDDLERLLQSFVDHPPELVENQETLELFDLPDFNIRGPLSKRR
jgi:glycosyltransferase involved in cell wall biosynthesis